MNGNLYVRDRSMNYRFCEECNYIYSTGKSYEDMIQVYDLFQLYQDCEKKGLCPFCNPKSIYFNEKHYEKQKTGVA